MKIKELNIKGYKSLVNLKILNPSPFTVFVGPNASGKSNIFEAVEFFGSLFKAHSEDVLNRFGSFSELANFNTINIPELAFTLLTDSEYKCNAILSPEQSKTKLENSTGSKQTNSRSWKKGSTQTVSSSNKSSINQNKNSELEKTPEFKTFIKNQSRIFINREKLVREKINSDSKLSLDASNLEKVLKRILTTEDKKAEFVEWLQLLIPGFDTIEIKTEELSGSDNLLIYEKGTNKPFNKNLISDGTFNIISLLTVVFQSDEPQFLCIEEPENGLNPKVVKELVNLFREMCKKGHFIWINTHSQSLVSQLKAEEIILVDKINGETQIKQISEKDTSSLPMDEAWLTNTLGGGIPW